MRARTHEHDQPFVGPSTSLDRCGLGGALPRSLPWTRTQTPAVSIVAMSGGGQLSNTDLLTQAAALGADRIIQKPIPLGDLLAMVRELLGEA